MDAKRTSHVTAGLIVVTIGVMLLVGQFDAGRAWNMSRLWPLVFIALGVGYLLRGDSQHRGAGLWFLFLGGLFLLDTFRILSLRDSWPLFIVVAGVSMLWPGRAGPPAPRPAEPVPPSSLSDKRRPS